MVRVTCIDFRSTTATWFAEGSVTSSQRPSSVGRVPNALAGRGTHILNWSVCVSMTASCGLVWSAVNTQRSSTEIEMRGAVLDTGMTATGLRALRLIAVTVPALMFDV